MIPLKSIQETIRKTLTPLGLHSKKAESMLVYIMASESLGGKYRRQKGGGPALSVYQIERATHDDIWKNFLKNNKKLANKILNLLPASERKKVKEGGVPSAENLVNNDEYATAMAGAFLKRTKAELPDEGDEAATWNFYKKYWNTRYGKAKEKETNAKVADYYKRNKADLPWNTASKKRKDRLDKYDLPEPIKGEEKAGSLDEYDLPDMPSGTERTEEEIQTAIPEPEQEEKENIEPNLESEIQPAQLDSSVSAENIPESIPEDTQSDSLGLNQDIAPSQGPDDLVAPEGDSLDMTEEQAENIPFPEFTPIEGEDIETFDDQERIPNPEFYDEMSYPDNSPVYPGIRNYPKKRSEPSFSQLDDAIMRKHSDVGIASNIISDDRDIYQEREEGFDAINEGFLEGVHWSNYEQILMQPTRKDAQITLDRINQEMEDDDIISRSGWIKSIPAYAKAYAPWNSPSSLIPFGAPTKAITMGGAALSTALKYAKSNAILGAVKNSIIYGQRETGTFKEGLIDTISDSIAGGSIGLIAGATGHAIKLNKAKAKVAAMAFDNNVDFGVELNKDGTPTKFIAVPHKYSGSSAGAMEASLNIVQKAIDANNDSLSSAVKNIGGIHSPVVSGYTDQSKTVQQFYKTAFNLALPVAKGNVDAILLPSLAKEVEFWHGQSKKVGSINTEAMLNSASDTGTAGLTKKALYNLTGIESTKDAFNDLVSRAVRAGGESTNPHVAKSANEHLKLYGWLADEAIEWIDGFEKHTSTNIVSYLNRVPNIDKMTSDPKGYMGHLTSLFERNNKIIEEYNAPIDLAKSNFKNSKTIIKDLKASLKETKSPIDREKIKSEIRENYKLKERYSADIIAAKKEVALKLDDPKFDINLVEPETNFTSAEIGELERLTKPLNDMTAEIESIKGEFKTLDAKFKGEDKAKILERKSIKDKMRKAKEKKLKYEQYLENEYTQGRIDAKYVIEGKKKITFHDPMQKLKRLKRPIPPSKLPNIVEGIYHNYTKQSEAQIANQIMGVIESGGYDSMKARVVLFNDADMQDWFLNDIDALRSMHVDQMSKRIMMAKLLKKYKGKSANAKLLDEHPDLINEFFNKKIQYLDSEMEGFKGIAAEIMAEKKLAVDEVLKKPQTIARDKEIKKINKKYSKSIKKVADGLAILLGKYTDRGCPVGKIADYGKKFGVINMLGNVTAAMVPEFGTPFMRKTFRNYVMQGLIPEIKNMAQWGENIILKKGNKYKTWVKNKHADAMLGTNVAMTELGARQGIDITSASTKFEKIVDQMVHTSMNLSGANALMSFQEKSIANAVASDLVRISKHYLHLEKQQILAATKPGAYADPVKGLLDYDVKTLDTARINPRLYARRISDMFDEFGEVVKGKTQANDAYIPNYHLWTDFEAMKVFAMGINSDVRIDILLPGQIDRPLFMSRHPILGAMTLFTSYVMGATTAYTLPTLTSMDRRRLQGIAITMGLGSMVGALRQLSRGEKPDLRPKTLFNEALQNSAILGWFGEYGIKAATYLEIPGSGLFTSDRQRSKFGDLNLTGPVGGMIGDAASVTRAIFNNEWNQRDALRLGRLTTGVVRNIWTQAMIDAMFKSTSRFETRGEAARKKGHKR